MEIPTDIIKAEIPAFACIANLPQNQSGTATATATATHSGSYSLQSIEHLVDSALDKKKRKFNVIIFKLSDTASFHDEKNKLSKLFRDLRLEDSCFQSITRIGRSNRDRPLKVTLSFKWYSDCLIDSAYRLASIRSKWLKLSISLERTYDEMSAHYQLMNELRRRQALEENVRSVGDNIVLDNYSVNYRSQISTSLPDTSSINLVSSPSLPFRVNLPSFLGPTSLCQPHPLFVTTLPF